MSRALYSDKTELFAEFRPLIVGQATRLTAHLTKVGDRFQAYTEGKAKLTLTVGDAVLQSGTDVPERPGVFRIMVTPAKAGMGHMVIEIATQGSTERFNIDDVPVYADTQSALEKQAPTESGLISYSKELQWDADFANAPAGKNMAGPVITVPPGAIVQDQGAPYVYVLRTPEVFEMRAVKTGGTRNGNVEITTGLRPEERIVIRGADKMPRRK